MPNAPAYPQHDPCTQCMDGLADENVIQPTPISMSPTLKYYSSSRVCLLHEMRRRLGGHLHQAVPGKALLSAGMEQSGPKRGYVVVVNASFISKKTPGVH